VFNSLKYNHPMWAWYSYSVYPELLSQTYYRRQSKRFPVLWKGTQDSDLFQYPAVHNYEKTISNNTLLNVTLYWILNSSNYAVSHTLVDVSAQLKNMYIVPWKGTIVTKNRNHKASA